MTEVKELTERQAAFVQEYLVDLNGAAAAIRAGFSPSGAAVQATRLLTNDNISIKINELKEARGERTKITADRVLAEIAKLAFSELRQAAEWSEERIAARPSGELDDATSAAIAEVSERVSQQGRSVKIKMHDKLRALELLARHLGMLNKDNEDQFRNMTMADLVILMRQELPKLEGKT